MSSLLPPPPPSVLQALKLSPVPLLASLAGSTASTRSFSVVASELSHSVSEGWKGKTVLITGAASGIGAAVAREAGKRGANVVLGDLASQEEQMERVAADIKAGGGQATFRIVDVTSWSQQLALFRHAVDTFGKIDVVFANAGMANDEFDQQEIELDAAKPPSMRTLRVNLEGVAYTAKLARYFLGKNPSEDGRRSSSLNRSGSGTPALYCTSKHAVLGLARSMAPTLANEGIRTVYMAPFYVRTPLLPPGWVEACDKAGIALLSVEDVARGMLWAAARDGEGKGGAVLVDASGLTTVPLEMLEWTGGKEAQAKARL
ncbi:hypothetical protein JCM10207_005706 [Rhodosporidiobolus poonsookiae]